MPSISPPRARPVQYKAPLGTRWEKEKANVPRGAFDLVTDPRQIGPWVLGECVGKGASGRVKVARHVETGQMAAVKILPLEHVLSSRHRSIANCSARIPRTMTRIRSQSRSELYVPLRH